MEQLGYTLPKTDGFVELMLLDGGSFIGEIGKIHAGVDNATFRMYNWAFHVSHRGRHILWDLGLDEVCGRYNGLTDTMLTCTKDRSCYTPWVNKFMLAEVNHVGPKRSIVTQLAERGISAEDVDTVLFRYLIPQYAGGFCDGY